MRFTYDDEVDALYVYLREGRATSSSLEVDAGRVLDLDDRGAPVGVEILGASRGVRLTDLIEPWCLQDLRVNLQILERTQFRPSEHA